MLNGRREEKKTTLLVCQLLFLRYPNLPLNRALHPNPHDSHLLEQWYNLLPESHRVLVIGEETHKHAIHTQLVETLKFESRLLSRPDDWQSASTESEHLEGKLVE